MKKSLSLLLAIFISLKASSGIVYQFEGTVSSTEYQPVDYFGLSVGDSLLGTIVFDNIDGVESTPNSKHYSPNQFSITTKNEVIEFDTASITVNRFRSRTFYDFYAQKKSDSHTDGLHLSLFGTNDSIDLPSEDSFSSNDISRALGQLQRGTSLGGGELLFTLDSFQINPKPSLPDNWISVALDDKIYRIASRIEDFNGVFDEQGRFIEVDRSTAGKLLAASQSIGELKDYDAIGIANSMDHMRKLALVESALDIAGLSLTTFIGNKAGFYNPINYIDPVANGFAGLVTDGLTIANESGTDSALYAIGVASYEYALGLEGDTFTNVEAIINTKNSIEASTNNPNVAVVIDSVIGSREKMAVMQGAALTAAEIWDDIDSSDSTDPLVNFYDNSFRAIGNIATSFAGGYAGVPMYVNSSFNNREAVEQAYIAYAEMIHEMSTTPFNHLDIFEEIAVDFGFTGENPVGLTPLQIQPLIPEGYVQLSPLPYGEAEILEPFIDFNYWDPNSLGEGTCQVLGDFDSPLIPGVGDNTWMGTFGSPVSFVLNDVLTPEQAFFINFEFMFDASDSLIKVYLNNILLDTLFSNDYALNEFFTFNYLVNDPSLWGISTVFELFANGNSGNRVFYNDVQFLTLAKQQSEVSEPSALALIALSLIFLSNAYRKRRSKV